MDANEEFLKALAMLAPPKELEPSEYRIYYDEGGTITIASERQHPDVGTYIIAPKEQWENHIKYRVNVVKKCMEKVVFDHGLSVQLRSSDQGYCVVKDHAGIILDVEETYKDVEYYAANS